MIIHVYTALFTVATKQNQPRCPSTHKWTMNILFMYTMEFYSMFKNNEIIKLSVKWVEIENVILRQPRLRRTHVDPRFQRLNMCI